MNIDLHILVRLQIEKEKLFVNISVIHAAAVHWEEKAQDLLATKAPLSELEDILRLHFKHLSNS